MGFDTSLIVEGQHIPQRLFCVVCLDLFQDPVCGPCEHVFCRSCILEYLNALAKTNQARCCPQCRKYLVQEHLHENSFAKQLVGDILFKCPQEADGCPWQGPQSNFIAHQSICSYGSTTTTTAPTPPSTPPTQATQPRTTPPSTPTAAPQGESAPEAEGAHDEQEPLLASSVELHEAAATEPLPAAPDPPPAQRHAAFNSEPFQRLLLVPVRHLKLMLRAAQVDISQLNSSDKCELVAALLDRFNTATASMSVKDIKEALTANGIAFDHCVEKSELLRLLLESKIQSVATRSVPSTPPPASAPRNPQHQQHHNPQQQHQPHQPHHRQQNPQHQQPHHQQQPYTRHTNIPTSVNEHISNRKAKQEEERIRGLSATQLKRELNQLGVDCSYCIEKSELVALRLAHKTRTLPRQQETVKKVDTGCVGCPLS